MEEKSSHSPIAQDCIRTDHLDQHWLDWEVEIDLILPWKF